MSKKEIIYTQEIEISCIGKEAPFDHPLVYLKIDTEDSQISCPYCSKTFILNTKN